MAKKPSRVFQINLERSGIVSAIWELQEEGYLGYGDTAEGNLFFKLAHDQYLENEANQQKLVALLAESRLRVFEIEYAIPEDQPVKILFYCLTKDERVIKAKITLTMDKMEVLECDEEFPSQYQYCNA